jgi:multicomponent Na+:H+ antiporter subunit G
MSIADLLSMLLILAGSAFFLAGTLGLLRFPDIYTRLHALTKADNVGLGLTVVGLTLQVSSGWMAAKLLLIWLLVMFAGSAVSQLIARNALQRGIKP